MTAAFSLPSLYLFQGKVEVLFVLRWNPQQKNFTGILQQGNDAEKDEYGDKQGAYGVRYQPAKLTDEDCGYDDTNTAQRIRQHMQKDSWKHPDKQSGQVTVTSDKSIEATVDLCYKTVYVSM